jgi:Helix-turn-helix family
VPRAWTLATPGDIVAKRFEVAEASLRRLIGEETPELTELADLAKEAAERCGTRSGTGRPMYAAYAEADWPDQPHAKLWHAATLLREYRGDGHVAILINSGLEPLPALITHTATGTGFVGPAAKTLRGWSDEQWEEAADDVKHAGLLNEDGTLTRQGVTLRQDLEDATNRLAERPWQAIGAAKADRIHELASTFSKHIVAAGAFPDGIFADPRFRENA